MSTAAAKGLSKTEKNNLPRAGHKPIGRKPNGRPKGPGTAFANFLIDYLPRTGLTNQEISNHFGYAHPNMISMWKSGASKIPMDVLFGLSDLLQVPLSYLLGLYVEQYVKDMRGGVAHFDEILDNFSRIATKDEWEIIKTVREARNFNSMPLKQNQRSALKKIFAVPAGTPEGALKQSEFKMPDERPRRHGALVQNRGGLYRDVPLLEDQDAAARKAEEKTSGGRVLKSGSRS